MTLIAFRCSRTLMALAVLVVGAALVQTACSSDQATSEAGHAGAADEPGGGIGDAPNGGEASSRGDGQRGGDASDTGGAAARGAACRTVADAKGDCQRPVCNDDGSVTLVPDDLDKPDDQNDCTLDQCKNGKASHPPTAEDSSCGVGGKLKCDGNGNCANCTSSADCGGSNPCATFECIDGTCQTTYVVSGQGKLDQQPGDCKKNVCNGEGATVVVADVTDLPIDDNPCTKDVCSTDGVAAHPPVTANTSCGANLACDGQGHCACIDPTACNGKCGDITDNCGKTQHCGNTCGGYDTCGGGGTAHVCGCTPVVPDCHYGLCGGLYPNGCGQNVACIHYDSCLGGSCGNCQGYCGGDNVCVCDQPPCS